MKYQLVLQWSAASEEDHDAVVTLTDDLKDVLSDTADVDGWDFGSGEMNVFIYTDDPAVTFDHARATLAARGRLSNVRSAYREVEGEDYIVLWPQGLSRFDVL